MLPFLIVIAVFLALIIAPLALIIAPLAINFAIWKRCFRNSRFEDPDYDHLGVNGSLSSILSAYMIVFCLFCFFLTMDILMVSRDGGILLVLLMAISVWIALPFIARASSNKAQTRLDYFHIKSLYIFFNIIFHLYLGRIYIKILEGFGHGRPFRIKGRPVVSKVSNSSEWSTCEIKTCVDLDLESRRALEAVWLDSASKEHASVPAFSKLSLQLIAMGAPPELIAKVFTAGSQEITHAKLCFSVAASLSGRPWSPNPMPQILGEKSGFESLEDLILECFVDGCLMEALSAAHAQASSQLAVDTDVKHVFSVIAEDENFHAELSWEILKFLLTKVSSSMEKGILSEFKLIKSRSAPEFYPAEISALIEKADRECMRRFGILPQDKVDDIWSHTLQRIEHQLSQVEWDLCP